ncbi:MAG: PspC domain-containing protein [Prevotellaceae bacterium]|jgi:phage shock protein PspC (stress-responsive transcriptional regulator)|nr:PspC domain-containing protein [Prevotellaceae bacterium]
MKKVTTVNIGGFCFTLEEDAFNKLNRYLDNYAASFSDKKESAEVMGDIESRIAEIFREQTPLPQQVVDMSMVDKVISIMGTPEGQTAFNEKERAEQSTAFSAGASASRVRKLYRDPDRVVFGGVCSGLSAYFGIDLVLVRVLFIAALCLGTFGFWLYIILWAATPKATTTAQKLEMHGEPVTMENIWNYTKSKTFKK